MTLPPLSLPSDLASAHAALLAERAARLQAEAEAANAKARLSSIEALKAVFASGNNDQSRKAQPVAAVASKCYRAFGTERP